MTAAKMGDSVKVSFRAKPEGGLAPQEVGDLEFRIGEGEVIPGLERLVVGMTPKERKSHIIPAKEAFGEWNSGLVVEIDRSRIPAGIEARVGHALQVHLLDGRDLPVIVKGVTDSKVTVDANHPLAGMDLEFEVNLLGITESPEEPDPD